MVARSDKEWETRTLCSDGNCIGVVGPDGRCKACGLPYEGKLPEPLNDAPDDDDVPDDGQTAPIENDAIVNEDDREAAPDDAWEERTLCIDESCIGVVGNDGRCKECGKPHPDKQP